MPPRRKNGKKPNLPPSAKTEQQRLAEIKSKLKIKVLEKNKGKTICLTMIVKNESKIIKRLLDSLIGVVDMISIVDTGSDDNTEEIILNWGKEHDIPTTVHHEPFRNFGYNRSHSIQAAKETYPNADYLLLSDADFIWVVDPKKFNKKLLFEDKFLIKQVSDYNHYWNIRMLSAKLEWHCVGVTHEYWDEKPDQGKVTSGYINSLKINDIEDGGSKGDKYERDFRLFTEAFKTEEDESLIGRYKFYYAQTLKCLKKYKEAIVAYQEKIDYKINNYQETFHSWYSIGECRKSIYYGIENCIEYMEKREKYQAEQIQIQNGIEVEKPIGELKEWQEKHISYYNPDNLGVSELKKMLEDQIPVIHKAYIDAHENRTTRIEPIYRLTEFYRKMGKNKEAHELIMKYGFDLKMDDRDLFVEYQCYDYLFDYELSIVGFYVDKDAGYDAELRLLDRDDLPNYIRKVVERNAKHYI